MPGLLYQGVNYKEVQTKTNWNTTESVIMKLNGGPLDNKLDNATLKSLGFRQIKDDVLYRMEPDFIEGRNNPFLRFW